MEILSYALTNEYEEPSVTDGIKVATTRERRVAVMINCITAIFADAVHDECSTLKMPVLSADRLGESHEE